MTLPSYRQGVQNHTTTQVYCALQGTLGEWDRKAQGSMMCLHTLTCNFFLPWLVKVISNC